MNVIVGDREYLWQLGVIQEWHTIHEALSDNFRTFIKIVRKHRKVFLNFISNEDLLNEIIKHEATSYSKDRLAK